MTTLQGNISVIKKLAVSAGKSIAGFIILLLITLMNSRWRKVHGNPTFCKEKDLLKKYDNDL